MNKKEIVHLLSQNESQELFDRAYLTKLSYVGSKTYLRALLEYSNICFRNCFYCGIRAKNERVKRFEISIPQMKKNIEKIHKQRYASFVIQSGERSDPKFVENIDNLIKFAKKTDKNFKVVLSTGEQTKETYQRWYDSGADRYLLRIETSNHKLYKKIHPKLVICNWLVYDKMEKLIRKMEK